MLRESLELALLWLIARPPSGVFSLSPHPHPAPCPKRFRELQKLQPVLKSDPGARVPRREQDSPPSSQEIHLAPRFLRSPSSSPSLPPPISSLAGLEIPVCNWLAPKSCPGTSRCARRGKGRGEEKDAPQLRLPSSLRRNAQHQPSRETERGEMQCDH